VGDLRDDRPGGPPKIRVRRQGTTLMQLDDEVCLCFHVTKRKILNHIRIHQPRVPSQISACAGAGTGCGWCIPFLRKYFEQSQAGREEADALSREEYARGRGQYLRAGLGVAPPGATPPPDDTRRAE
jgi:bacterioferritin-associated ferredoxin